MNVFKKDIIHYIITISSPNHASPLANPDNNDSAIGGILATITSIFLDNDIQKNLISSINNLKDFNVIDIQEILEGIIKDVKENNKISTNKKAKINQALYSF